MRWLSSRAARSSIITLLVVVALWEIVGQLELIGGGAFPPLSDILRSLWRDWGLYPPHVGATLQAAVVGFLIGNGVAIAAAILFAFMPLAERFLRGIGIALFSVPLIALVPVLILAFGGSTPRIVLAAIAVYFTTMVSTLIGLRDIDPRLVDVVRSSGGGSRQVVRWVRLRSSVPSLLAGLRVAAPAAVLGAILAEYGSGTRYGLGTFLLGSLGTADPARLWGIGVVATAVAGLAYLIFGLVGARVTSTSTSVTVATASPESLRGARRYTWWQNLVLGLGSIGVTLGAWVLFLELVDLFPVVARSPAGVWRYLVSDPQASEARDRLFDALGETLPQAFLGLACGLTAAFVLATLLSLRPTIGRAILPFALVSQTMPLVALTPLIVLVFGRDILATLVVTISVTFFPSFVTISQGLDRAPGGAVDVVRTYNASDVDILRRIQVPNALPYLLAAARLAAPRALLGVMIAEYLATGNGIGNLLNDSRGRLDYGMIWSVAAVSVIVAVLLYQGVVILERLAARRFST